MALAVLCANNLAGVAVQDLWRWGKQRVAALLGRGAGARRTLGRAEPMNPRQARLDAHRPAPVAFGDTVHHVDNVTVFSAMNDYWARCTAAQRMTAIFLCGPAGVGRSTALRQWLRSLQDVLPEGVLHADLSPDGRTFPVDPDAILERWLNELGAPREDHPAGLDRKTAEVRRLVQSQPVVVVLENVTELGQVRPLLPHSSSCVLLMTGLEVPRGLESLLDFESVYVAPLRDKHALDLLLKESRSTERPKRLRPIARQLDGLPLTVRVVAGRLTAPVPGTPEGIAAQLAAGTTGLFHVLDMGYDCLGSVAARFYRRLGVMRCIDFRMDTVLALMPDEEPAVARRAVDDLVSAQLVTLESDATYRVHHVVQDHAAMVAARALTDAQWKEVGRWIVRHYLSIAESGETALSSRWRYDPMNVYAGYTRFAAVREAYVERHLRRYRPGLLAAVFLALHIGMDDEAWRLCQGLWSFYLRTASHTEWIQSHEIGLVAAQRRRDPMAEARMRFQLGFAHLDRWHVEDGDIGRAREHFEEALRLVRRNAPDRSEGERRTESSALEALGLLELKLKRPQVALAFLDQADQALHGIFHPRGLALLAYHRACAYTALRRHDDAERTLREARTGFAVLGEGKDIALNIGKSWLRYAEDRRLCGQLEEAVVAADSAIEQLPEAESEYTLAAAHLLRGDLYHALGDALRAAVDWECARDLFTKVRSRRADEARDRLEGSGRSGELA
ncbi:hypothetical protein [Streptomyces sp. NPDC059575]|uniref:hypothetical protein n=1 Tax=Streptomyces sp. NPDC059575 TaxID=3346872 RepID=UPI0036958D45